MSEQSGPNNLGYSFVVVSNRLPVDHVANDDGSSSWRGSPGGLVTALEPVMRASEGAWVGWAGVADQEFEPFINDGISIVPVALSQLEIEEFYEGFSNDTLWPLYHDVISPPRYHREWWDAYVRVNERFAAAAARIAAPGATVWVHDYQLQLVPQLLRAERPDLTIGFFNHIPFPPYGIFSQLPWRRQIVRGLLGADVIGFQRTADAGNFSRAVRRLSSYTTRGTTIEVPGDEGSVRRVIAKPFPISIDSGAYAALAQRPDIQERAKQIRTDLGNPTTIILGVDRLDYTKGIGHRFKAYGELLAEEKLDIDDVALVQVASPSRERVEPYMMLRDEIELQVGRINGEHSTISHQAITYLHHGYPREEMVALYLAADVMLVTALRDGMNLVAKEYVAVRSDNRGVLVLSEFAGASDELKQAVKVNPHDIDGLKMAILEAIDMEPKEQAKRMRLMRKKVLENDVARWSRAFLQELHHAAAVAAGVPPELEAAVRSFAAVHSILVALDFDGTLAPHVDNPDQARALRESREAVMRLLALPGVRVAFVSGRALVSLQHVADPPEGVLVAGSHGVELQLDDPGAELELLGAELAQLSELAAVLDRLSATVDGAWIERKPAGFALHTRLVANPLGAELQQTARSSVEAEMPGLRVIEGKNVLEFSVRRSTKGDAVRRLREHTGASAVFYAGDDATDEDAFATLGDGDLGLKIGQGHTRAEHRVRGPEEVAQVLRLLADIRTVE